MCRPTLLLGVGGTLVVHVDTNNILPAIGCQLLIPFIFWGSIQPFPGERPALAGKIVTGMHKQLGRREKAGGRGREGKKMTTGKMVSSRTQPEILQISVSPLTENGRDRKGR